MALNPLAPDIHEGRGKPEIHEKRCVRSRPCSAGRTSGGVEADLRRGWPRNGRFGRVCGSILKNYLVGFFLQKMHFSQISHRAVTKRVTGV